MKNRVKPTAKQAKALELIREGTLPTLAMRKAGYSAETSRTPGKNLIGSAGAQSIIEKYKSEYTKVGITPQYMAAKTAEWLQAKKVISARIIIGKASPTSQARGEMPVANSNTDDFIEVEDYQTQLKAAEMVRKDWGLGQTEGGININAQNVLVAWSDGKEI